MKERISIEIDEMACKALLLWMQSRQKFVGEVDFGGVSMTDEDWNAIFEEENEEQSDEEDSEQNVGKGIDCDGEKISEEAAFLKGDNFCEKYWSCGFSKQFNQFCNYRYHQEVFGASWKLAGRKINWKTVIFPNRTRHKET